MGRIRTVAVFPTVFTLANLICGFFAIVVAARVERPTSLDPPALVDKIVFTNPTRVMGQLDPANDTHNIMLSGWLIFLAMIFDALDGHVARLARTTTDFGAQLDSLCDVVSFGVAPGFLLVKMCPAFTYSHDKIWLIAATFAACAALRLARFNVETDEQDDHLNFHGLPSPAAAASIAGFAILFYELRRSGNPLIYNEEIDRAVQMGLPFFALMVALLMVSRIPYPHVVNQMLRGQRSFGHVVALVFAFVAIMSIRGYSVPVICGAFVLVGPIRYAWQRLFLKRPSQDPIFYAPRETTMFTGLVQNLANVHEIEPAEPGCRLIIEAPQIAAQAKLGDSIAINGCCLTVVEHQDDRLSFDAGPETLARTNLGELTPGSRVNIEASLRVGDALGGHFVTGHVEAVGTLDARADDRDWSTLWFRFPPELGRYLVPKGSVAVDGVSLTLVEVQRDRFSVALIPHTLAVTTLGALAVGGRVNLETDLLAKYAQKQLQFEERQL